MEKNWLQLGSTEPKNEGKVISQKLQGEYLYLVEKELKKKLKEGKLPTNERQLEQVFTDKSKPPTYIDRVRYSKESSLEKNTPQELWLVVDFDDVLNKTTTYTQYVKEQLCKITSLKEEEFEKLYDESKVANEENKKVLRFSVLVGKIKELFPGKETAIDKLLTEEIDTNSFVDQGMKRALLSLENDWGDKIRVSILTFGDINYQKGRIDKTDVDNVVDDIIYTEGSKREVLETLIEKDYKSKNMIPPFIITIDDSPEQIDDYDNVNIENRFINMHFQNPQAKRFKKKSSSEKVIPNLEVQPNEAALNLYKIAQSCLDKNLHKSREEIYEMLHGQDINDFYRHRNRYDLYGEPFAVTADETGKITTTHYPENFDMHSIPAYSPFLSNFKYSKDADGTVYREYDRNIPKENSGIGKVEYYIDHVTRKIVMKNGVLIGNYTKTYKEEFIERAE